MAKTKAEKSNLDRLNANVTAAVRTVEEAYRELAHAELALATATSPTSVEGRIARRGAIRAVRGANDDRWVERLLELFLYEDGIDEKLKSELRKIGRRP